MTEPNRQSGENEERIIEIEIERLRPFKEHPFQVKDDKEMFLLQESIEKYGILNPLIVRPVPDGYYEIISGHRRKHAAEKLGYRKVPVIIRVLSEDDSILSMVDSNLHRERISYSETVVLCDYVASYSAALAKDTIFAFLFNFKDYVLNTNYSMGVKKYEDNDTDDQITKGIMLVDGKVVDKNSLVVVKKIEAV